MKLLVIRDITRSNGENFKGIVITTEDSLPFMNKGKLVYKMKISQVREALRVKYPNRENGSAADHDEIAINVESVIVLADWVDEMCSAIDGKTGPVSFGVPA